MFNSSQTDHSSSGPTHLPLDLLSLAILLIGLLSILNDQSFAAPPSGTTAEEQGEKIFLVQDHMDVGYQDAQVNLTMSLSNAAGHKSQRKMKIQFLEMAEDGDKTLITFQYPRDIKGTGLLTYEHIGTDDDQWLYLPALKRVKRIASKNKRGSFVGSEFSYEDISSNKPAKYKHRYLREDTYDGAPVWIVERSPKDSDSGYSKIITWVFQSNYQTVKQEFFDRKGSQLKIQSVRNLTPYVKKFWRAKEITMQNVQTKKSTTLSFNEWVFQQGLQNAVFTTRSLKRQR